MQVKFSKPQRQEQATPEPEVQAHTTCCHNCQDNGEEVEVALHPEDGVWKGVCECGDEACFECPPDVEQFNELSDDERGEWNQKAKAEDPGADLSEEKWNQRARTLYIDSIYEAGGGDLADRMGEGKQP